MLLIGFFIKIKWINVKSCIYCGAPTHIFVVVIEQAFIECLLCAKPCCRQWSFGWARHVPTFMVCTVEGRGDTGQSRGSYDTVCQGSEWGGKESLEARGQGAFSGCVVHEWLLKGVTSMVRCEEQQTGRLKGKREWKNQDKCSSQSEEFFQGPRSGRAHEM